ncbi:MAG TPA: hypothetical protein VK791_02535 [bacterium]|jgi:hypothetical protein|nr:hypothetical protein [bacterium]
MIQFLKTSSRFFLILALLVLSLRPSAVNCPKATFARTALGVCSNTSISPVSSSEQVLRRCSFMRVETQHDLKFTARVILAGVQAWSGFSIGVLKASSNALNIGFSSGSQPLRI